MITDKLRELLLEDMSFEESFDSITNQDMIQFKYGQIWYKKEIIKGVNNGKPVMKFHMGVAVDQQSRGVGPEMIKSFLNKRGGVFYGERSTIVNDNIHKMIAKIKTDKKYIVTEYEDGITIEKR